MSQCNHTFVNCGFTSVTMACKKCGMLESASPLTSEIVYYKAKLNAKISEMDRGIFEALNKVVKESNVNIITAMQTGRHQSAKPNQSGVEKPKFTGLYDMPIDTVDLEKPSDAEIAAFQKLLDETHLDPKITISFPHHQFSLAKLKKELH
jgi:hypothetical protein